MIKRFKWLLELFVLTLFAWVAAGIITSIAGHVLYEPPGPQGILDIQVAKKHNKVSKGKAEYDVIVERDLLQVGKSSSSARPAPVEKEVVRPIAEMGLTLRGTIAGPNEIARAIIEEKREQKSYKIGDEVKGATVLAIYRNKVIMDVNGQEQMLIVEETQTKSTPLSKRTPPSSPRPSAPSSSGITSIMKNLDQYIGSARVVPYFKGGEPYGFRVSNLKAGTMVHDLGVRSGDIIRSVNGIPIRTPEDAFSAYQEMQDQSSVEVELERKGASTTITVPLQ